MTYAQLDRIEESPTAGRALAPRTVEDLVRQDDLIQEAMTRVLKDGVHFGRIPGVKEPSLWKAGAEKLCFLFKLDAQLEEPSETWHEDGHYDVRIRCVVYHAESGLRLGSGYGSCSTRESKYAYRNKGLTCPACGADTIRKKKDGGWFCPANGGGCGKGFAADVEALFKEQKPGKVPNPELADSYNTVLKMCAKRAAVAAVLTVTAASDVFLSDVGDERDPATKPVVEQKKDEPPADPPTKEQFDKLAGILTKLAQERGQAAEEADLDAQVWAREHLGVSNRADFSRSQVDALIEGMEQELKAAMDDESVPF